MPYTPPHKYTADELQDAAKADLLADAVSAEHQAKNGPFYPERDITPEFLRAYAKRCRAEAAKL